MDDVVDALLDDNGIRAVGRHFMLKAFCAHQPVGFIRQAVIFAQNPRSAGGAADDGSVLKAVFAATELQIIRPILRGDGVAITDDGAVLRRSTHGHIAEEVGQLRLAGCVHRNIEVLRFVAVGVQPAGQRAAGEYDAAHEREITQIEADKQPFPGSYGRFQRVGNHIALRRKRYAALAPERDRVKRAAAENCHLFQRNRLRAAVIIERQAYTAARKRQGNRIAQGYVLGIPFRAIFRNADRISPHADPLLHPFGAPFALLFPIIAHSVCKCKFPIVSIFATIVETPQNRLTTAHRK